MPQTNTNPKATKKDMGFPDTQVILPAKFSKKTVNLPGRLFLAIFIAAALKLNLNPYGALLDSFFVVQSFK